MELAHRHFIIGITGGIAAYKTCELVRRLQDHGATVQVVMTDAATQFVSALTFQAISGRPVYSDAWASPAAGAPNNGMAHIDLSREADAILVAPASADFMARLANGQSNDLLTTICLAREIPLLVAPAMNRQMWQQPATQRNAHQLTQDGITLLGPGTGAQACGETGDGRMLEPQELLTALLARFGAGSETPFAAHTPNIRGVLAGRRAVITAGPTFEPIDPVRGVTNRSSGKMGFALAQALREAGAEVLLVSGPVHLQTPVGITRRQVTTALQMHAAVLDAVNSAPTDLFIGVAAVADWRPKHAADQKIKKGGASLADIEWVENPDILSAVAHLPAAPFCVGFAAESGVRDDLKKLLPEKRARKHVPLLVGNIGADTFGQDTNHLMLCDDTGVSDLTPDSKINLARTLVSIIAKKIQT